jgi:hypothetical protein
MGFLARLFGWTVDCDACGDRQAKASFGGTKCRNSNCRNYDSAYAQSLELASTARRGGLAAFAGTPVEFKNPIRVDYTNFEGERKTFTADRDSIRVRNAHISLRVAPTGARIALKRDRISTPNLDGVSASNSVEQAIQAAQSGPTPHERYVMNYHKQGGTTSALYEQLRAKYRG